MKTTIIFRLGIVFISLLLPMEVGASGYEFEGIGARHVSRGGAAISTSDDWSSIYWNPANIPMASQKKGKNFGVEIFGGEAFTNDTDSLSRLVGPIFSEHRNSSPFILGALGSVIPLGEKAGLGVGVYTPLLQGSDFNETSPAFGTTLDFESYAGIMVSNISGGLKISEKLTAGAGINVLYGIVKNESTLVTPINTLVSDQEGDGWGMEGILGFNYAFNKKAVLGMVYRTGGDVSVRGTAKVQSAVTPDENTPFRYELRHPPTSGIGLGLSPHPDWKFSFDFTQTYWNRFSDAIHYDTQGLILTDVPKSFDWQNTWKIRFGSGYQINEKSDLSAGYSFDHQALDPGSIDLSTAIDVPLHRVYLGLGHKWNPNWETILGGVAAYGTRNEGGVEYRVSGYQLMLEIQWSI